MALDNINNFSDWLRLLLYGTILCCCWSVEQWNWVRSILTQWWRLPRCQVLLPQMCGTSWHCPRTQSRQERCQPCSWRQSRMLRSSMSISYPMVVVLASSLVRNQSYRCCWLIHKHLMHCMCQGHGVQYMMPCSCNRKLQAFLSNLRQLVPLKCWYLATNVCRITKQVGAMVMFTSQPELSMHFLGLQDSTSVMPYCFLQNPFQFIWQPCILHCPIMYIASDPRRVTFVFMPVWTTDLGYCMWLYICSRVLSRTELYVVFVTPTTCDYCCIYMAVRTDFKIKRTVNINWCSFYVCWVFAVYSFAIRTSQNHGSNLS